MDIEWWKTTTNKTKQKLEKKYLKKFSFVKENISTIISLHVHVEGD